ncbi:MAG: hypothetical protein L0241_25050 [Planctomycetia bacterium]|nr:hypothetical protein [Planctomycetia bacterium]
MNPNTTWPNEQEIARLTAELLAHQASAPDEIAVAFLDPLAADLHRRFPSADFDHCYEAAGTALLATVRGENCYDPARSNLGAFLGMVATRDLQNLLAREARHKHRRIPLEFVEEPVERGNTPVQDDDGPSLDDPRLVAKRASFAPLEQTTYELLLGRDQSTGMYARVLELKGTPAEVEREVKRIKDRVKVRLRRAVGGKQ